MIAGAALMAVGISLMHYSGMAAIAIAPGISYDPLLFAASVAIAFVASLAALWIIVGAAALAQRRRAGRPSAWPRRSSWAPPISGMHFTGMAAAHFAPDARLPLPGGSVDQFWLAVTLAARHAGAARADDARLAVPGAT